MKSNRRLSIGVLTVIFLVICLILAYFIKGPGLDDQILALLSVASFLYGIFIAFAIANSHSRFSRVSELLKEEDGMLTFVYRISSIFGNNVQNDIRKLIDNYLIDQLDYFLSDYHESNKSFVKLFDYIINIKPEGKKQEISYDNLVDMLAKNISNRKLIETLVQEPMLRFEWVSIITLWSIIVFSVFYINNGGLVSIVITSLLSTTGFIFILVLRELNDLRWKEKCWVWHPLEALFLELELVPYLPAPAIEGGRIRPSKGQTTRVAYYPNPYPSMVGKEVKLVQY